MTKLWFMGLIAAICWRTRPLVPSVWAQKLTPETLAYGANSTLCNNGGQVLHRNICIQLPPQSVTNKVDVFFLIDDTGSFVRYYSNQVQSIANDIVQQLEAALPAVDFGFGVGHFEDFDSPDQPFILNQNIITVTAAGSKRRRNSLLQAAWNATSVGRGGDYPESVIEGLYRAVTGNASSQTAPGGANFRPAALKLILLMTDSCSVAPFSASGPIPPFIVGTFSTEPSSAFSCRDGLRFGQVGDVAPADAGTVPQTIMALNAQGVRVLGLGPGAVATSVMEANDNPSVFMSALARLTGAVDAKGRPLVFDMNEGSGAPSSALIEGILATTIAPVDIAVVAVNAVALSASVTVARVNGVSPGGMACFDLSLTSTTGNGRKSLDLQFQDAVSQTRLGVLPVTVACTCTSAVTGFTLIDADLDRPISGLSSGSSFPGPSGMVDYAQLPTSNINVRADVLSCDDEPIIDSVLTEYVSSSTRIRFCERWTPYSVFRDDNAGGPDLGSIGLFQAFTFPVARNQTIRATPWTGTNCQGVRKKALAVQFDVQNSVPCPGQVLSLVLWDTDSQRPVHLLESGASFCPNLVNFTIEARVMPCTRTVTLPVRWRVHLKWFVAGQLWPTRETWVESSPSDLRPPRAFLFGLSSITTAHGVNVTVVQGGGPLPPGRYRVQASTSWAKLPSLSRGALQLAFEIAC